MSRTRQEKGGEKILTGAASWSDPGFIQKWFPKGLSPLERLPWYARHFEMVEVNSTFYSVPDSRMVTRWCRGTPDTFIFDVKLHRLLSRHATSAKFIPPKLRSTVSRKGSDSKIDLTPVIESAMIDSFRPSLEILRDAGKLGMLLLQLSPSFSPKMHALSELENLLTNLSGYRIAIEFRNRHWLAGSQLDASLQFLRRHKIILILVNAPAENHFTIAPSDLDAITNPRRTYLRLHGRNAKAYLKGKTVASRFDYDYSDDEIEEVAERSRKLKRSADEVHVVFNNNNLDYAPRAALRLRAALGQIIKTPPRQGELFAKH